MKDWEPPACNPVSSIPPFLREKVECKINGPPLARKSGVEYPYNTLEKLESREGANLIVPPWLPARESLETQTPYRLDLALREKISFWKSLDSEWAVSVIANGLFFEFEHRPPPFCPPLKDFDFSESEREAVSEAVRELILKGAVIEIPPQTPGLYSRMFLVPKPNGAVRPVLDLKRLNQFMKKVPFKMEAFSSLRPLLKKGDWLVKIDLKDAYLHVPLAESAQRFVQFQWGGKSYRCRAMIFGITSAPRVFTKLMKVLITYARSFGIRIVIYLDDILILASSVSLSLAHRDFVLNVLVSAGFTINYPKSNLEPSQDLVFLGLRLQTLLMVVSLPHEKLRNLRRCAKALLQSKVTLRDLARFLGKAQSGAPAIVPANLHMFHLRRRLKEKLAESQEWDSALVLDSESISELRWWREKLEDFNGRSLIVESPTIRVVSDASAEGYGGFTGSWEVRHEPPVGWEGLSSNERELTAATNLVSIDFQSHTQGQVVEVLVDNITAAWTINRGYSASWGLFHIIKPFLAWCLDSDTTVVATYLPGALNYQSDGLSRKPFNRNDWGLRPELLPLIEEALGVVEVDFFASDTSTLLPRFFALPGSSRAEAYDAFMQKWSRLRGFANPPFNLIPRVLQKVEQDRATIVLIAPLWPSAIWWPDLMRLAVRFLPLPKEAFSKKEGQNPYEENPRWNAAAWLVSGNSFQKGSHQLQ